MAEKFGPGLIIKEGMTIREIVARNIGELERAAAEAVAELADISNPTVKTRAITSCAQAQILRDLLEVIDGPGPRLPAP